MSSTRTPSHTATGSSTATPSGTFNFVGFTPNNVLVSRVGDGSTPLSTVVQRMFIDEFTSAGVFVQSVPLPQGSSPGQLANALTMPGQNPLLCTAANVSYQYCYYYYYSIIFFFIIMLLHHNLTAANAITIFILRTYVPPVFFICRLPECLGQQACSPALETGSS